MFSSAQHGAWKVGDYTLHGSIGTESQWYVRLLGNAPSGQVAQIEVVKLTIWRIWWKRGTLDSRVH